MHLAPIPVPQMLIVGAHDKSWGPVGRTYFARARAAGDTVVELVEAPEAGHFEVIAPKSTTWPLVVASLRALVGRMGRPR
jgi:hypothetical protein